MVRDNPLRFARRQWTELPVVSSRDLSGKVVVVTGSNTGLGKEAARHLAAMNPARLILAVRSIEKGEEAVEDIVESTHTKSKVEVWPLDLADFASVQAFADRAEAELDEVDIFLENAGVNTQKWQQTHDGYERTLQINVISTAWLALRFLPLLRQAAKRQGSDIKPHLTIVASDVHYWATFKGHDSEHPIAYLNDPKQFVSADRYNCSKLLDLFIAREIAALAGPDVIVNAVNPGLCESSLLREATFPVSWIVAGLKRGFARTTEVGARNYVWACLNDTQPGAYISECQASNRVRFELPLSSYPKYSRESDFALSAQGKRAQASVWSELLAIIGKHDSKAVRQA